jgi:hypothetical protein
MGSKGSRLLLAALGLAALTAVVQAVAINRASSVFPSSWTWATSPAFSWSLVIATLLLAAGLANVVAKLKARDALQRDREAVTLRNDFSFQTPMTVHRPPSARIRWKLAYEISYAGTRVLTVEDIVPLLPVRTGETADGLKSVKLVRTKTSSHYTAFHTFGDAAKAQRAEKENFGRVDKWPLLLQPGQKIRLFVEQEYELRVAEKPITLSSNEQALELLGPYFELPLTEDGDYLVRGALLRTRIVCRDDEWIAPVPYWAMPVGVMLRVPSPAEREELLEGDDLA